ncbi:hypothetical protein BDFB_005201 [Asbolus verrucosus]|uniref:P450 domain containing protein n=1 Tax=Asbolus verrucosus TaxID=1661398 RepID=A0A482VFQ9_ASBVE|nr:hypothetical protein BDFB_005201 [Asbolus verrucosus]
MKLPRFITHDGAKRFISTTVCNNTIERSLDPKKLEHYRNLNALDNADIKPNGWDEAKPFEAIPGPKPLPIIGNTWRFILPKIGTFYGINFLDLFKILHEQYGDVMILKGMLSRKPMVLLFDVNDFETV